MHIKNIAIECTGMCKSYLGSQLQVIGDQKPLNEKINAYSWKAQWTSHSGEIPHSRTVAFGMLRVSMVWGRMIHTPNAASAHSLKTESHLPLLSIWHPQQDLIHPQIKHTQLYYGNKFLKLISEI